MDVTCVIASPDGKWIASSSNDRTVIVWHAEGNERQPHRKLEGHTGGVMGITYSADGEWLASGSFDNTVKIWNVSGDNKVRVTLVSWAGLGARCALLT